MPDRRDKTVSLERENERLRVEVASLQARVLELTSVAEGLRQSEARYRHLHLTRIDGFARVSLNGRIEEVNELFCEMVGYSEDELRSLTYHDLTPEKWHASEDAIIQSEVLVRGHSERYEKEYRRKDGTVIPVEVRAFVVPDQRGGPPSGLAAVVRDITRRKRSEQALRESEEKFKTAFLTSVDAFYISTLADGSFIEINAAFERMFGYSRHEVIDQTSRQLGLWVNYDDRHRMRDRLLADGFVKEMETLARRKNGEVCACSLSTTALHMQGRHCIIGVVRDVSERKRAEEALRVSEEQYRLLFDHMLAGVIVFDVVVDDRGNPVDYRFVTGNPAYERMTGHRVADDRGKTRSEWTIGWPPDVEQRLFDVAMTGVPVDYERFNESLGRWYDARVFSPRRGQFAIVFTDITERKAAEAALEQAQERLRDLTVRLMNAQESERSRLARELHDDFSQRLALLAVNLHLLRRSMPEAASAPKDAVTDLYREVQALARDVRRTSHDLHPARLEQLGLASAIRGLCEELEAAHRLAIRFPQPDVPREIPEPIALCLYRVAQGALQNIIRHSGATEAIVELAASGAELRLTVTDNGRGFDTAAPEGKNSLGLASIRERVHAISGRFEVKSEIGRGTRIEVRVPVEVEQSRG